MLCTVIGLVGGIASGKSTVAKYIRERLKAVHVDADAVAHRVLDRPAVRRILAERFPEAKNPDGSMNRKALAELAFLDPAAHEALERATHPHIERAMKRAISRARAPFVLLDAALLQETGADALCDLVVYVACPARERRRRARTDRGWSEEQHRRREARQWSCVRKRSRADLAVDNGGGPEQTRLEVGCLVDRIRERS